MKQDTIDRIQKWDEKLFIKYRGIGGRFFTFIMKVFTFFGREPVWLMLTAFYIYIFVDFEKFFLFGDILLYGLILVVLTKRKTKRDRPYVKFKEYPPLERWHKSSSFPSWHTYNVVAMGCTIGFIVGKWWIYVIFLILAAIVGFSRIQLGVHYPTDVIVGYLLGFIGFLLTLITVPFWMQFEQFMEPYFPYTLTDHAWNLFLGYWWFQGWIIFAYSCIAFVTAFYQIKKLIIWITNRKKKNM